MNTALLKRLLPRRAVEALRFTRAIYRLSRPHSYLVQTSFLRSHATSEIRDGQGEWVPWMNYAVVAFLKERLHPELTLFEYGCGYSTVWFARRVKAVVAVETDKAWLAAIAPLLTGPNVTLLWHDPGDLDHYAALVCEQGELFDLIVIDGLARVACAQHSVKALTEGGVLVWDDSTRLDYADGLAYLRKQGFKCLNLRGLKTPRGVAGFHVDFLPGSELLGNLSGASVKVMPLSAVGQYRDGGGLDGGGAIPT